MARSVLSFHSQLGWPGQSINVVVDKYMVDMAPHNSTQEREQTPSLGVCITLKGAARDPIHHDVFSIPFIVDIII